MYYSSSRNIAIFVLLVQEENRVERTHGDCISENKTLHHHELLEMIDGYEAERGKVAVHLFPI
jgi:hypothetical protein